MLHVPKVTLRLNWHKKPLSFGIRFGPSYRLPHTGSKLVRLRLFESVPVKNDLDRKAVLRGIQCRQQARLGAESQGPAILPSVTEPEILPGVVGRTDVSYEGLP